MSKSIVCNICGKRFDFWDAQEGYSIHTCCGYGSAHDGDDIELDICCKCFDKIVDTCAVNPVLPRFRRFPGLEETEDKG